MSPNTSRIVNITRIVLGVGLSYYLLRSFDGWDTARQLISTGWLAGTLTALNLFGVAVEAKRLSLLLSSQHLELRYAQMFRLSLIGAFFNFCVPGGLGGDASRLYYLTADHRARGFEVATVLLVDRIVALGSLLAVIVGLAALNLTLLQHSEIIRSLAILAGMGLVACVVVLAVSLSEGIRRNRAYVWLMGRFPFCKLQRIPDALLAFRNHKGALVSAVLWSISGHIALAGTFLALKTALMPSAPATAVCMLALLGLFANQVPITPGGLGVGEAAFDKLFHLLGYSGGASMQMAWRASQLPICVAGGLLYAFGIQRAKTGSPSSPEPEPVVTGSVY
jgi:uncharacterized protein (TIRG00374 family)